MQVTSSPPAATCVRTDELRTADCDGRGRADRSDWRRHRRLIVKNRAVLRRYQPAFTETTRSVSLTTANNLAPTRIGDVEVGSI
jgi:hypothetical protein